MKITQILKIAPFIMAWGLTACSKPEAPETPPAPQPVPGWPVRPQA